MKTCYNCDVLIISNLFPPQVLGGYEIAASDVAKSLEKQGLTVAVLTSQCANLSDKLSNDGNVRRTLRLAGFWGAQDSYSLLTRQKIYWTNACIFKKTIDTLKPRLIYVWNLAYLGRPLLKAINSSEIPSLHHVMGYDLAHMLTPSRIWSIGIFRRLFKSAQKIKGTSVHNAIFISKYVENYYESLGIRPLGSCVIHQGIDVDKIKAKNAYAFKPGLLRIVFLGQATEHKGIFCIANALNKLAALYSHRKFSLTIIGSVSAGLLEQLSTQDNFVVEHCGFVDRRYVYQQLGSFDLGIFSSLWAEPFGIAQLELMAAGLPLISSARGGSAEPLQPGINSLVYDPNDRDGLYNTLVTFIESAAEFRSSMGLNAIKTVTQGYQKKDSDRAVHKVLTHLMLE